jgi:hypothetical protein
MRVEPVEIYSDATNRAIMRHPGRKFPGVVVQGDSLFLMCQSADAICATARGVLDEDNFAELNKLRNALWSYLTHYKSTLIEHGMSLPFSLQSPSGNP